MGNIRLACMFCDRSDFDGVPEIPLDWFDVQEIQSFEASRMSVDFHHPDKSVSVLEWYTHLGVCPECYVDEIQGAIVV